MRAHYSLLLLAAVACGGTHHETPDPGAAASTTPDPDAGPDTPAADAAPPTPEAAPPRTACTPTSPRATPVTLSVLPDESETPQVQFLQAAQTAIKVFGYEMGYGGILDTLKAKATAGLDVRVILDGNTQRATNDKYRAMLEAAGAKFEWSDPKFSYMHAKTLIVDGQAAMVSTSN